MGVPAADDPPLFLVIPPTSKVLFAQHNNPSKHCKDKKKASNINTSQTTKFEALPCWVPEEHTTPHAKWCIKKGRLQLVAVIHH